MRGTGADLASNGTRRAAQRRADYEGLHLGGSGGVRRGQARYTLKAEPMGLAGGLGVGGEWEESG